MLFFFGGGIGYEVEDMPDVKDVYCLSEFCNLIIFVAKH